MKKYFNSLSFFRVFAFLNVFLLHVSTYRVTKLPTDAAWAVSFFFMISAFLYGYKFYDKDIKLKDTKQLIIKKLKKIYPLYFVMILLFMPYQGITHLKSVLWEFIIKLLLNLTMTQCWAVDLTYSYSFNPAAWFVSTLMMLMLITIPLCKFFKIHIKKVYHGIIWIIVIFGLDILYINHVYILDLPRITFLYVFPTSRIFEFSIGIILGIIMKMKETNEETVKTKKKVIFTMFEILTVAILILSIMFLPKLLPKYYNTIVWMIPNILIFIVFSLEYGYLSKFFGNKFFVYLGSLTFPAYMVHQYLFTSFYVVPSVNDFIGPISKFIALIYLLLLCFILAAFINKINLDSCFKMLRKKKE